MEHAIQTQRDLLTIESEINVLTTQAQHMALQYIFEIGRRLIEAKALVPHGEWGNWLTERVNYTQRTASNYMKIYVEYGDGQTDLFANSQPVANLDYSKALALLAVPRDERADFAEQVDAEHISKRELEQAIRERDEARKQAEQTQQLREQLESAQARMKKAELDAAAETERVRTMQADLETAKKAAKKAKAKIKELKENPEIPVETLDAIKAEEKAAAEKAAADALEQKTADLREQLKSAEAAKADAEQQRAAAAAKAAELEKKLLLSSPDVASFNVLFRQMQEAVQKVFDQLGAVEKTNADLARKFHAAVCQTLQGYVQ